MEIYEIFILSFVVTGFANLPGLFGIFLAAYIISDFFGIILLSIDVITIFGLWMIIAYDWLPYEFKLQHPHLCFTIFIVASSVIILCWIAYITWKIIERYKNQITKKVT